MLVPANSIFVGTGRCLNGKIGCEFYIRSSVLHTIQEDGPAWKYKAVTLIPVAIADPYAIFEGLARRGYENAACYCYAPEFCTPDTVGEISVPTGKVFLVYVEILSGSFVIQDWAFRREDQHYPGYPVGWRAFDKGVVWQRPKKP
jgi:hypothetical protein